MTTQTPPAPTLADQVAEAVARCPSVARLSGGIEDGIATYLPGRRVTGVAIRDDPHPEVRVHVVGRYGPTMRQITDEVTAAVRSVLPDHRIQISIDDLDVDSAASGS